MDFLKKMFPFSLNMDAVKKLVITIILYVVASTVVGFLLGLLSNIPVVGLLVNLISYLFGLYCTGGIVVAILVFAKVIK